MSTRTHTETGKANAESQGIIPKHSNPAVDVERFEERDVERFLTSAETARLGDALTTAATIGIPPAPTKRKALKKRRHGQAHHESEARRYLPTGEPRRDRGHSLPAVDRLAQA